MHRRITEVGLFSSLFGHQNSLETRLVNEYAAALQATGMSAHEA